MNSRVPDTAARDPRRLLRSAGSFFADRDATPDPVAEETHPDAERILRRLDWHVVRRLDGLLQGDYRSLFTGHGLDLAEVRAYQPGDDARFIDWNVTARMDEPYVRRYLEDREITAWLLLDTSASVDFGTARARKRDLLVDFAGVTTRLLTRRGNRVGAMLFSGAVDDVLPARGGRGQALTLIHQLARPDARRSGGPTNLGAVLDRAGRTLRRRSLVFVASDFIAAPGWETPLRRLAQRHELVAVWLRDPREEDLPDVGPLWLEDAETGEQMQVDTGDRRFRARFHDLAQERRRRLAATVARVGAHVLELSTDGEIVTDFVRFVQRRKLARGGAGRVQGMAMADAVWPASATPTPTGLPA
jgi:uncharacterized protein (DUF58 family)